MARLIDSPTGGGPVGAFEQAVVEFLRLNLPDGGAGGDRGAGGPSGRGGYTIIPNFSLRESNGQSHEYDVVVLGPHGIYVVEAKEWYGRLTGDDTEWLLNQNPRKCPMWLVERKAKVLKSALGAPGRQAWIEPVLVVPDGIQNNLGGRWSGNLLPLVSTFRFLTDPARLRHSRDISSLHEAMLQILLGNWGDRRRGPRKRIGAYEVLEVLHADDEHVEYRARRALFDDPSPYRVRTWHLSGYANKEEREERLNHIKRPTEALARIGRHPNLLQILEFNEVADDSLFYEVTEWSDFGTLHGYLRNDARDRLTLRERLEIASGIASALDAVHDQGLVHRDVCPETVLIAFDRQPRLTDFDRAYIEDTRTVFPGTENRKRNPAYVAPELRDATDYDFDSCSDMYSFGVLLYELLTEEMPFDEAGAARGKPSELREGVDQRIDELVAKLLVVADFRDRPTAKDVLRVLHEVLGSSKERSPKQSTQEEARPTQAVQVGNVVDGVYRIDEELGSGAFSKVYKVFHLDHGQFYAMKVLTRPEDVETVLLEFENARALPSHENIARVVWQARLAPPSGTPYILSEFIDGEPLTAYCKGDKRLPWQDIQQVGVELLDALAAMHPKTDELERLRLQMQEGSVTGAEYDEFQRLQEEVANGILHRDIKPANILLETPQPHRAKLIDFNIASKLMEAKGRGGTPRYWAPDRGQPEWRPDMDLFSLGLVLYELTTHRHPFPDDNPESGADPIDPRVLCPDLHLSDGLAEFLLKSCALAGADRFQSAREMQDALRAVESMHAPVVQPAPKGDTYPGLTLQPDELGRANYNPYVTRLLTLYSQAKRSNTGTRGLDEIAQLTYVKTKLDDKLVPRIADGAFRLVIVTGNAGDGKTAFLQKVEALFRDNLGVAVELLESENGAKWEHGGLSYETNYDGSQDEGNLDNDRVLASFLEPFMGDELGALDGRDVRLIAINEGRLLDFLEHSVLREKFGGLRRFVHQALSGDEGASSGALLVNLNLRAVATGSGETLVERQLRALIAPALWKPCQSCALAERCPLKFNADTLSDDASGTSVVSRVRQLLEVVHRRRRMHVTMRDLRSALSWLILKDHGCADIARVLEDADEERQVEALAALYYPEAYSSDAYADSDDGVQDRLVSLLREVDVGLVNSPALDGRLDREPHKAVPWMTFERRSPYGWEVVDRRAQDVPESLEDVELSELLWLRRDRVRRWRRWAYFERRDEGWRQQLPYQSLVAMDAAMTASGPDAVERARVAIRSSVLEAVSLSEGLRAPHVVRKHLALRVSRVKSPTARSFRLFDHESFTVEVPSGGTLANYIEFAPDSLELRADAALGTARMKISLDLLEMLELIRSGYRPNVIELQGLFVNLQMFRNELLSLPFDRILVAREDDALFEIVGAPNSSKEITLSLRRFAGTEEEGQA